MKHLILYFTAIGNSLEIAKSLQSELKHCEVKNILRFNGVTDLQTYDTIGFVYPCYNIGTPHFILQRIEQLTLNPNCFYYGIVTHGGNYGNSLRQLQNVLTKKQCQLNIGQDIRMGSNHIMLHNTSTKLTSRQYSQDAKLLCVKLSHQVINEETLPIKRKLILLSNYLLANRKKVEASNRKSNDRKFYATSKCNNCGICNRVCPLSNVKNVNGKPVWQGNCIQCSAYINRCPQTVIEYGLFTKNCRRYSNPNTRPLEIGET